MMTAHTLFRPALQGLAALQGLMLLALMAGLAPHPPETTPLFAMGPFLSASIALCVFVAALPENDTGLAPILGLLAGAMALISYGPHKWFDANIALIWPAVLLGQAAATVVIAHSLARLRHAVGAF